MSNSLTGANLDYVSKYDNHINNLQNKYSTSQKTNDLTFSKMLESDKTKKKGEINIEKLDKREKKLYESCVEMESLLWKIVLNSMRKTTNKYKLIDGGQAEEIFTDFLYDEYSMMMSKNSQTGLSKEMFKQLSLYV